jgi:hypothetical protein
MRAVVVHAVLGMAVAVSIVWLLLYVLLSSRGSQALMRLR